LSTIRGHPCTCSTMSFSFESLLAHSQQFPHDIEGYVVPCMRKIVKSGYPDDAKRLAERILAGNPSTCYLMMEFLSRTSQTCQRYTYGQTTGTITSIAVVYNRYE